MAAAPSPSPRPRLRARHPPERRPCPTPGGLENPAEPRRTAGLSGPVLVRPVRIVFPFLDVRSATRLSETDRAGPTVVQADILVAMSKAVLVLQRAGDVFRERVVPDAFTTPLLPGFSLDVAALLVG